MKNLLSREEYLQSVNEGFGDNIKKGWNKFKSVFKSGFKRIKNYIFATYYGYVLPVVTIHAIVDKSKNVKGLHAFTSKAINDEIKSLGGNPSPAVASYEKEGVYSECPYFSSRDELVDWYENEEYKNTNEYKNFLTLAKMLNEGLDINHNDELNEDINKKLNTNRRSYREDDTIDGLPEINGTDLEEKIQEIIENIANGDGDMNENMLIFGAPGIGKSSIARFVCNQYNKTQKDVKNRMSVIIRDFGFLEEGDFQMPRIPKEVTALDTIRKNNPDLKLSKDVIDSLSDLSYNKTEFMCPDWLPVYRKPKDGNIEAEKILELDSCGVTIKNEEGYEERTEGGGIIILDEFLRAKPGIFHQLMNFLIDREINGWKLSKRWAIIACSNRPVDSDKVAGAWQENYQKDAALGARFPRMFRFSPNEESWAKWAKDYIKCPQIILDYIFDPASKIDKNHPDEFPRFHSTTFNDNADKDSNLAHNISPREWATVIKQINHYCKRKKLASILDMTQSEILKVTKEYMDGEIAEDFAQFVIDNAANVSIDEIIANPKKVKPRRSKTKETIEIIDDIYKQCEESVKKDRILTDEELSKIVLWFGINFPDTPNLIETQFMQNADKLCGGNDKVLSTIPNTIRMWAAAYPDDSLIDNLKEDKDFAEFIDIETVKSLCEENFPHRLNDDGEIIPIEIA